LAQEILPESNRMAEPDPFDMFDPPQATGTP
jgi:hypothetical protein